MNYELRLMRSIEERCYPEGLRALDDCEDMDDVLDYCEDEDVRILLWTDGYCAVTSSEVVDLCCTRPMGLAELRRVWTWIVEWFGDRWFTLDAREGTSWRLLQYAQRRGWIDMEAEGEEWRDGERFVAVRCRALVG
jgi:hypothetical protein